MSNDEPLWSRINYTTDMKYYKYHYMREYDISKANISMLLSYGLINDGEFYTLYHMDKSYRESTIGRRIRDEKEESPEKNSVTENTIKNGIIQAKKFLFDTNDIKDDEVLRIANDSVLVCRSVPLNFTNFILNPKNMIETSFVCNGEFTSFVKLARTILLLNSQTGNVIVKGINDDKLPLHQDFLTELCQILYYKELGDSRVALMKYHDFYNQYINRQLPLTFYREFNAESGYRLINPKEKFAAKYYGLLMLPEKFDRLKLNISYNLYVLRDLYPILIND